MLVVFQLFALFLLVALGFYVFVADPRKRAHQTFAAFIAFLAVWTVKDLTRKERQRLEALAQAIVVKSGGAAALVEELGAYVSPHAGSGSESRRGQ